MDERFEQQDEKISQIAASFSYPATPDVAARVRQSLTVANGRQPLRLNRLAWAMLLIISLLLGLAAVPQVRAAVQRIFNIGAITIFELDEAEQAVLETAVLTATKPIPSPLVPSELALEVTAAEVRALLEPASLYLPAYPVDLPEPDHIYWVDPDYQMTPTVISIWKEEGLALYQIGVAQFAWKGAEIVEDTAVNGQRAAWIVGPHFFWSNDGRGQDWQYVAGNVLIWWHEDGLTFRLEGASSLEEAVRIAESLEKLED
jgi:hypothetical protein